MAYWPTGVDYANLPVLPFACVDIGSNTTRLLVAEVEEGHLREVATVREFTSFSTTTGRPVSALSSSPSGTSRQSRNGA